MLGSSGLKLKIEAKKSVESESRKKMKKRYQSTKPAADSGEESKLQRRVAVGIATKSELVRSHWLQERKLFWMEALD
jgi:hypothetical protein